MNAQPWHRTLLRQMARAGLTPDDVPDEAQEAQDE